MYTRKRSVFEIYRISKKNSNEESSFSRYLFKFLRSKDKCSFTRIEFESLSLVIGGQVRDKLCSRHAQICRSRAHFRRTRETRSSRGGEVWNGKELSVESFLWVERQNALLCSVFERWRLSKECWLWLLKYNSLFLPFLSSPSSLLDHRADLERSWNVSPLSLRQNTMNYYISLRARSNCFEKRKNQDRKSIDFFRDPLGK